MQHKHIIVRQAGLQSYPLVYHAMHTFTEHRTTEHCDEIWLVEHPAIYTQGQNGKAQHLLTKTAIPLFHSDRGGQITYHGPGQQIVYVLINLKQRGLSVRQLVVSLENAVIASLATLGIMACSQRDAPGVYVDHAKICSLGLRIRHGCSLHGLALNINMDLDPFKAINPCGYPGQIMTQVSNLVPQVDQLSLTKHLVNELCQRLDYPFIEYQHWSSIDYD